MTDRNGETIIIHYKNIDDKTETNVEPTNEQLNQQPDDAHQPSTQQQQQQQQQRPFQEILNEEAQRKMIDTFLTGSDCLVGVYTKKTENIFFSNGKIKQLKIKGRWLVEI